MQKTTELTQELELAARLGFPSLNPMQEKALREGFLESERVLVTAPTASGKTLLALMAIARELQEKKKSVYVVPLRALASEKHRDFTAVLAQYNASVGIATGDYDSSSAEFKEYDVLIVTSEKLDSLLRHDKRWLDGVGLVVVDELHLINDDSRGATMEMVLTKIKNSGCRLVGLSATIPNNKDVAEWLGAKLVESDYRPTKLVLGISDGKKTYFEGETGEASGLTGLVQQALKEKKNKGQILVFVSTRRSTQSVAEELGSTTTQFLGEEERADCAEIADKALNALPHPTAQCRLLAECLRKGIAFHNAGIESRQRELIEEGFKHKRCLKAIVCTTTLAMGIDYPASWVILKDLKRFNGAFAEYIPALEVAQMTGRAGRPRFDSRGIAVLMCGERELTKVRDKYVFGGLEKIYSKLSSEPLLRGHCLALIASNYCNSFKELYEFFNNTFYASQYGDSAALLAKVENVVGELREADFVREKKGVLVSTPVGKRASELYIDPLTAKGFVDFLSRKEDDYGFLVALQDATEARPLLRVKAKAENVMWEEMYAVKPSLAADDYGLDKYYSAKLLDAWVNEGTEDQILQDFDVPPGVLHARVRIMEWLAYSMAELAFLLNASTASGQAKRLRRRIKHGIKEELLDLTSINGIGRVRARKLWNAGVKTGQEFEALPKEDAKKILNA